MSDPNTHTDHHFPCGNCGSDMAYAPGTAELICTHCARTEPIGGGAAGALAELDFRQALAGLLPAAEMEETRTRKCPSCGAEVEFDKDLHATECPFCATQIVTDTGTHRHIKPRGVLPFALDERTARKAMTDWLGSLWFAPSGLQEFARKGRRMQGIYAPYWTYDADTRSRYIGERGTVYYETRTVTVEVDGRQEQREQRVAKVRWTPVSGRVARFFDDVLVLGSKSLPKEYTDGLEPWDLAALEPYQPAWLAGFRAEAYSVPLDEGYEEARAIMERMILRDVKFDIGGDRQRVHHVDTDVRDVTFKHILLPVWMAAYKYRGKSYRFVVNGRTGRVRGARPWSAWKIAVAVALGLVVAGIAGYLIATNEQAAHTVIRTLETVVQ